jgi:RNA polymerase sigma factor (sigma-70 family)
MAFPLRYDSDGGIPRAATAYLAAAYVAPPSRGDGARGPAFVLPPGIAARIRARDAAAFETLVALAYHPLIRFARGLIGSREAAEDVVQDVLAAIWERAEQWAPTGNPVTYLFGTVRHRAIDAVRRASSESVRHQRAMFGVDDHGASADQLVADREDDERMGMLVRALETYLATLSERQRTAYDLRYRQGLTIPEIAEILGITTRSGEQLLRRLVHAIRERMRLLYAESELGRGG